MKASRLFLLAVTAGFSFYAAANELHALQFLQSKWASVPGPAAAQDSSVPETESFRIGGTEIVNVRQRSHKGFVIYAPGETSTIIGYSDRAILDSSNLPQALTEMLVSYPQITGNSSYPITTEPVEPIIKTRWHQLAPFNGSCPDYRGQATPAGCTAVAVAQILNHFRSNSFGNYLLEYKDQLSGAEISIDFGKAAPYDWENMLDDYSGNYTQPQADAVARLMFEAGAASLCEYFPGSTSGKWALVALSRYFNYEAEFLYRNYLPTRYWMDRIYRELQAGRPIIYGGTGYFPQGAKAHEFIIDGCDSDGLVHINWGWGGEADGYYDVTYCKAEGSGMYDEGYNTKQLMICGLHPRTDADEPYSEGFVVTSGTTLYNNNTKYAGVVNGYTTNIYSIDNIELEWDLVRVHAETGEYLEEIDTYHTGSTGIFPEWGSAHIIANIWKAVTPGKYQWKIASRRKGSDDAWTLRDIPMQPYSIYTAEGTVAEQGYDDYDGEWDYDGQPRYALTGVEPITEVIAGSMFFARISTRSISDYPQNSHGYSPGFSLAFTDMESGKVYVTPATISNAYDNHYLGLEYSDIKAIEAPVNPANSFTIPAGHYRVTASDSKGNPDSDWLTDNDIYIDVKDKVKYPILQYSGVANYQGDYITGWLDTDTYMQTPVYRQDHTAYLRLYGSSGTWHFLTSANDVWSESTVNVYLCPVDDPSLESEMILGTVTANMFPSQECDVPLNTNFYPFEGQYFLYLRYMTPDGERDILPQRWDHVDPATGLGRVPTNILVNAPAAGADIPKLQVWNVTADNTSVSFDVKNIGTTSFYGSVSVAIYNRADGTVNTVATPAFTIEPSQTAAKKVTVSIDRAYDYDAYFRCLPTAARNGNNVATFATKPSGEPARYAIDLDNSGINDVTAMADMYVTVSHGSITVTGAPANSVMTVYTLDGRAVVSSTDMRVNGLATGLYIVSVAGRSFKVIL